MDRRSITPIRCWCLPTTLFLGLILLIPLTMLAYETHSFLDSWQNLVTGSTSDTTPSRRQSPLPAFTRELYQALNLTQEGHNACSSEVCLWNSEYLNNIAASSVHPCDDFYEHVCGSIRSNKADIMKLSFVQMSRKQLMKDFEFFFERFFAVKKQQSGTRERNFLTQAKWMYATCKRNLSSSDDQALEAFRRILVSVHLNEWPYANFAGDILKVVSTADRQLMLQAIFTINVLLNRRKNGIPHVVLKAPVTYLSKLLKRRVRNSTVSYKENIVRALHMFGSYSDAHGAATRITELEVSLRALSYTNSSNVDSLVRNVTPIDALRNSHRWDWLEYFALLFNSTTAITPSTKVFVEDPPFFAAFPSIFDPEERVTTIANYVGLKVLLELWPFMPRACHFLYTLDRDPNTAPIDARVAACRGRLEKVFRYGVGIAAKLTPSGEFADVYRRDWDEQLAALFRDARVVLKELLQSRRSWFSQRDGQRAVMKLDGMTFAFGTQHNFRQYEAYRRTPDLNMGPNASVLDAIFALFSHASSIYWSAFTTSAERSVAYDNTYTTSAFDWDGEYQPTNNHVFLPNGVVGFLGALSNKMPLQLYPVLSQNIVRTMLQALLKGNSLLDGNGTAVSEPWSKQTQRQYDSVMACLRRHHDADEDVERQGDSPWTIADSEAMFLDSAVIGPTYELYNHAIQGHNETGLSISVDTRMIGPERLFFYNYASAHCDYDDLERRRVRSLSRSSPSKIRLNLALNNFPPFLETFSCAAAEGPGDRCVIWKGPASAKSMRSKRKVSSNLTYHLLEKSGETNATHNLQSLSSINDYINI